MTSIGVGFVVLWMVVAFFALRFFAIRVFAETGRAEIAALAVVVAFTAGAIWPFSERIGTGGAPAGTAGAAADGRAAAAPSTMRDVSALCAGAKSFSGGGLGSIDIVHVPGGPAVNDGGRLSIGAPFVIEGWGVAASRDRPATAVCFVVDGRANVRAKVAYGGRRPDVAAAYHAPSLERSAFAIAVPGGAVSPGTHRVEVAVESQTGAFNLIPGKRTIEFR